jgi:hypothetical protein
VRPGLEKTLHKKRAGGVAQGVGPEFKSQHDKKKIQPKYAKVIKFKKKTKTLPCNKPFQSTADRTTM